MGLKIFVLAFLLYLAVQCSPYGRSVVAAPENEEILSLPGWLEKTLPSRMYTGYVPVAEHKKHLHYFFVESQGSPKNDPVILWMQGGPGASGFYGLFTEMGPFSLSQLSLKLNETEPVLLANNFTWTKLANIIFFESPVGTGYSYCDGKCPINNDTSAALDNHEFIVNFFEKFPEFKGNDFYIAGESYGGIYVPMLADEIMKNSSSEIRFRGVAVGNGCTGLQSVGGCGPDSQYTLAKFLHGHGQISTKLFENITHSCPSGYYNNSLCAALMVKAKRQAGVFNEYALYDECYGIELNNATASVSPNDYPCYQDRALKRWVTSAEVKAFFKTNIEWQNHDGNWAGYVPTKDDVLPIYDTILGKKLKVMIYYGDTDTAVSYVGGESWVTSRGFHIKDAWRPWCTGGGNLTAGHFINFEEGLRFVTVSGAGHLLPRTRPRKAFAMFENWLKNLSWKKCSSVIETCCGN
ncbi:putative Serine carboxypeptidase-like 36 [Cardiosporidium cionae]|uniref:Carboxypeptidase n=1 Tax=Cardiosporidium cionae TaxID=476202 RepID=A0ABQ7JGA1_9APIC|nr:putative Serine carboxypeptidase-like 36 [Cardiosporidium cionae]|eukprot:KAF8823052.1 putative Serine carboxypeptidase-like 36 [Cardiosporidium cionae]